MLGYPMNISVGKYLSILKLGIRKNNYILT